MEEALAGAVNELFKVRGRAMATVAEIGGLLGIGAQALPSIAQSGLVVANLKQFRDAVSPELACYQALVESPCVIQSFKGAGLLSGDWEITLTNAASHAFAQAFGIPNTVRVHFGTWVQMSFVADMGRVLWRSGG